MTHYGNTVHLEKKMKIFFKTNACSSSRATISDLVRGNGASANYSHRHSLS